jgi:hypothetical protein
LKASSGAGIMGLGDRKELLDVPEKIVELGQSLVYLAKPTASFDYAEANRVCFYFVTVAGFRLYECGLNELNPNHPFFEVFDTFTKIKRVADSIMDEINSNRKNSKSAS